jgi:hypothetical protein
LEKIGTIRHSPLPRTNHNFKQLGEHGFLGPRDNTNKKREGENKINRERNFDLKFKPNQYAHVNTYQTRLPRPSIQTIDSSTPLPVKPGAPA